MRIRATVFLIICTCAMAFGQAEDPALRKEIQKFYGNYDKLVNEGNVPALLQLFDPSFTAIDREGRTSNWGQAKKQFTSLFKMFKDQKSKIVVDQIQAQGNEVVAWITMTVSFKMKAGNEWKPNRITAKFAETLKRSGASWKLTSSQMLPG
jgi:hypothetical protein